MLQGGTLGYENKIKLLQAPKAPKSLVSQVLLRISIPIATQVSPRKDLGLATLNFADLREYGLGQHHRPVALA